MNILKKLSEHPVFLLLLAICTFSGKSIFYLADKLFSIFGMTISDTQVFRDMWDQGSRIGLFLIIAYLLYKQDILRERFNNKIMALRELRDIDVRTTTHHIVDLNDQNRINGKTMVDAFGKVGVPIGVHKDRQSGNLVEILNEDSRNKQALFNNILDEK